MREVRVADTSAETATIGLVAAVLAFATGVAIVHVGSRWEREWMLRAGVLASGRDAPIDWVVVDPPGQGFQVSMPRTPWPWLSPVAASPSGGHRHGYRLVEPEAGPDRVWREYLIVVVSNGDGGVFDRGHPLPSPLLEALVADGLAPSARILSRRPLFEAGCSGLEVFDTHRSASGVDIYTRRRFLWSGPSTYAFAFSSTSRLDLTGAAATRFFGSIALDP